MRHHERVETFNLSPQGIDALSAWLSDMLTTLHVDRKNCLRACLMLEELLLRMQENLGEEINGTALVEQRVGRPQIRLEMDGAPFNPMNQTAEAFGDWNSSLMTATGLHPKYSYSFGKNTLRLTLPNKRRTAVFKTLLAVLIGVALGYAGLFLLPDAARHTVTDALLESGFDLWSRVLIAISGPIVFFMAVTTILNTKGITKNGGSISFVIGRFFLSSLLIAGFAYVCARPAFTFAAPTEEATESFATQLRQFLLDMIPHNIIEPFLDADSPQLFVLAIVFGGALVSLGDRVDLLKNAVRQINKLALLIAQWVSLLVPFAAGLFLCLLIWNRQTKTTFGMWLPLLLALGVSLVVMAAALLLLSVNTKVSVLMLLKKLREPFWQTLRTGELDDDAFETAQRSCIRAFGIDRNYLKTYLPQGLVLYMPISAVGALIFTMYTMEVYHVPVDLFHQIIVAMFAVLLFVVTPPVPGQNLLSYAVIFSWIGIPNAAIIDAMFFEILFGVFSAAGNLSLLQIETVFQTRRLGLLDRKVYERSI